MALWPGNPFPAVGAGGSGSRDAAHLGRTECILPVLLRRWTPENVVETLCGAGEFRDTTGFRDLWVPHP